MKLLIVDDSELVRSTIELGIQLIPETGIEVVGVAQNGREALERFDGIDPDIVTLDIDMPEMNGLDCLVQMLDRKPDLRVLVISNYADTDQGLAALEKGARFVLKKRGLTAERLRKVLTAVA